MKRPLLLLVLVLMTVGVWAQQISEEQARDRALKFLTNNDAAKTRGLNVGIDRKTVTAKTDAKSIYAFNLDGGGFVIASGDSRALPVLGYSATGSIDWGWAILYPMVNFRNVPGCDWQMLASEEYRVIAGRATGGQFYLVMEMPDLEITKAEFTKGPGRMGMRNDLTLTLRNKSERESTMPLYLVPFYFGKVNPADITPETPRSQGKPMAAGAYLRAGQDTEVTFCFKPMASGTVGL